MKKYSLLLFGAILFISSCEEEGDSAPPETTIISPSNGAILNEIVNINCMSTDNKGVDKVELWIDGVSTSLVDKTEPYSISWNTTNYEDGEYTLVIRAYDINGNEGDSNPIKVKVDNTLSIPNPVDVSEVSYSLTELTVKWPASSDADFSKYTLLESQYELGNKYVVETYNDKAKTSYTKTSFDPTVENWFWIAVEDTFGYSRIGKGKTNSIDSPPQKPVLNLINYDRLAGKLKISWEKSKDSDFDSYKLYESDSSSMSNPVEKFNINDISTIKYDLSFEKDQIKYFQLEVKDKWGLTNLSDVQGGDSHDWFAEVYNKDGYFLSGTDVHQTSEGGYIILSGVWNGSYNFPILIKTDSYGKEEWIKEFNLTGDVRSIVPGNIEKTSDGGYVFISRESVSTNNECCTTYYAVRKIDSYGTLEWKKSFLLLKNNSSVPSYSMKIKNNSAGGYVFIGTEDDRVLFIGINESGEKLWSSKPSPILNTNYSVDVEQTSNGEFIILGHNSGANYDFVLGTSSTGQRLWADERLTINHWLRSLLLIPNSQSFIATGGDNGLYYIKSGYQGQNKQGAGISPNGFGQSIELSHDDGYIIAGQYLDNEGWTRLFFAKTYPDQGPTPSLEWRKGLIIGKEGSKGFTARQTSDGGYVILGSVEEGNGIKNLILIKTDKNGNTRPGIFKLF